MSNFIRGFDSTYIPTITATPQTDIIIPSATVTNPQINDIFSNVVTSSYTSTPVAITSTKPITSLSVDPAASYTASYYNISNTTVVPISTIGQAPIIVNNNDVSVRTSVSIVAGAKTITPVITSFAPGSFSKLLYDLAAGAVAGKTPSTTICDHIAGGVINTSLYTSSIIDASAFSMQGGTRIGSLISPRHAVICNHTHGTAGDTLNFNGTTYTISAYTAIAGDIGVYTLSTAVTGVTPYSVLPPVATTQVKLPSNSSTTNAIAPYNYVNYLISTWCKSIPGFIIKTKMPLGSADVDRRQVQLCPVDTISSNRTYTANDDGIYTTAWSLVNMYVGSSPVFSVAQPTDIRHKFVSWYNQIANGDSGSPLLIPTGLTNASGKPKTIIIGTTNTVNNISNISHYITEINAVMSSLGYSLDVISTSEASWWNSFNNY
jgi:hypothetical protein